MVARTSTPWKLSEAAHGIEPGDVVVVVVPGHHPVGFGHFDVDSHHGQQRFVDDLGKSGAVDVDCQCSDHGDEMTVVAVAGVGQMHTLVALGNQDPFLACCTRHWRFRLPRTGHDNSLGEAGAARQEMTFQQPQKPDWMAWDSHAVALPGGTFAALEPHL